jgi:3-hydroxy acid dehydrogenase/malonic semialdehyde reductase
LNTTVFITGATSGIGRACVEKFNQPGYQILFCGRREGLGQEIRDSLQVPAHFFTCDVRNQHQVEQCLNSIPESFRNIDILINNAGLARGKSKIQDGLLSDWEEMIDTNIKGLLYVSNHVIQGMKTRNTGHIINIGSIAGKEVYPQGNVYCATKKAVDALSQAMRIDLMEHTIKVTQICPGAVNTEFSKVRYHGDQAQADAVYHGFLPLQAEDVADAIFYCTNLPAHVCINDLTIMPTAQASATNLLKS